MQFDTATKFDRWRVMDTTTVQTTHTCKEAHVPDGAVFYHVMEHPVKMPEIPQYVEDREIGASIAYDTPLKFSRMILSTTVVVGDREVTVLYDARGWNDNESGWHETGNSDSPLKNRNEAVAWQNKIMGWRDLTDHDRYRYWINNPHHFDVDATKVVIESGAELGYDDRIDVANHMVALEVIRQEYNQRLTEAIQDVSTEMLRVASVAYDASIPSRYALWKNVGFLPKRRFALYLWKRMHEATVAYAKLDRQIALAEDAGGVPIVLLDDP